MEVFLEDSEPCTILSDASKAIREKPLKLDRAKLEMQAWSEVGGKSVGAEGSDLSRGLK